MYVGKYCSKLEWGFSLHDSPPKQGSLESASTERDLLISGFGK